ncbi:FAD-dependent oxidoreductase [Novosphingobium sp.]|uniref:NAD(P)/FAD-dependent oxidoreductase n=1 Tax=Novosphingobium sp. TaxID=1874826 RepID=UPI00333E86F8
MQHVAIIGAGISGLSCAQTLKLAGFKVSLFDKGRGPGGRMASRRIETTVGPAVFDFGAQYFTVRDAAFAEQVGSWEAQGLVARWPIARPDAYVGVPAMNTIVRHLAGLQDVTFSSLIKGLKRQGKHWQLVGDGQGDTLYDSVVLALPAEQTAPILTLHDFQLAQAALFARSQPCWAAMYAFSERLDHHTGLIRDSGIVAWATRDNEKPGRSGPESWVVQATPQWSLQNLEKSQTDVGAHLFKALEEEIGAALPAPVGQSIHRWRYALSAGTGVGCLWNPALQVGACGDWLIGPRIESAWLSGRRLGERMVTESIAIVG